MTSVQDTDEDCLDDPIQLIGFDCKPASEDYKIIDLTHPSEEEKDSGPQPSKAPANLPVTFFQIPKNIELLKNCRHLAIKIVDCDKHPSYYRNVKRYNNKIVLSEENVDKTDMFKKKYDSSFKIRPVETPYEKLHRDEVINIRKRTNYNLNLDMVKEIVMRKKKSKPIDLKKNTGLVGLKITLTNQKLSNTQSDTLLKKKNEKNNNTQQHSVTSSNDNIISVSSVHDKTASKSKLQEFVGKTVKHTVKSKLSSNVSAVEEKSVMTKNRKEDSSKKIKQNNMESKVPKRKINCKKKVNEDNTKVSEWVEKKELMDVMKPGAMISKLKFDKVDRSPERENKLMNNNNAAAVITTKVKPKSKKQNDMKKTEANCFVNPKNVTLLANKTLVVKDNKNVVLESNLVLNSNQLSPEEIKTHISDSPKPFPPDQLCHNIIAEDSQDNAKNIYSSPKQHTLNTKTSLELNQPSQFSIPKRSPQQFTPKNVQVLGKIARITTSGSNINSSSNTQTTVASHLACQNISQVLNQEMKSRSNQPLPQKPDGNNISNNISSSVTTAINVNKQKSNGSVPLNLLQNTSQSLIEKCQTLNLTPSPQKPACINNIQVSGCVARVSMTIPNVQTCELLKPTQSMHHIIQVPKESTDSASCMPALPRDEQKLDGPTLDSELGAALTTHQQNNLVNQPKFTTRKLSINKIKQICQMEDLQRHNYKGNSVLSTQPMYGYNQQYSHTPNILKREPNKMSMPNLPRENQGISMPYLTSVAPVNQPVTYNGQLIANNNFNQTPTSAPRKRFHVIRNQPNQYPILPFTNSVVTPQNTPPFTHRIHVYQQKPLVPNHTFNYMRCAPVYDGPPQSVNVPNQGVAYWNNSNGYTPLLHPPPPPPPPPPPYPHLHELLNRPPMNPPISSTTGSTIIGENMSGPVRKINISATPSDTDRKRKNLNEAQAEESANVIYENVGPVSSKREMLEELSKVIDIDSPPPSPVAEDFRNPPKTHTASSNASIVSKPGPLSKKPKLSSTSPNTEQSVSNNNGYSPPILPIPSFKQSLEMLQQNGIEQSIPVYYVKKDINDIRKQRSEETVKKISINEYKQRAAKRKEKKSVEDKSSVKEQMKYGFQISVS